LKSSGINVIVDAEPLPIPIHGHIHTTSYHSITMGEEGRIVRNANQVPNDQLVGPLQHQYTNAAWYVHPFVNYALNQYQPHYI
jgi:hypothetical protein